MLSYPAAPVCTMVWERLPQALPVHAGLQGGMKCTVRGEYSYEKTVFCGDVVADLYRYSLYGYR